MKKNTLYSLLSRDNGDKWIEIISKIHNYVCLRNFRIRIFHAFWSSLSCCIKYHRMIMQINSFFEIFLPPFRTIRKGERWNSNGECRTYQCFIFLDTLLGDALWNRIHSVLKRSQHCMHFQLVNINEFEKEFGRKKTAWRSARERENSAFVRSSVFYFGSWSKITAFFRIIFRKKLFNSFKRSDYKHRWLAVISASCELIWIWPGPDWL